MATLSEIAYDPFNASPVDTAISAEGLTGPKADLVRSLYQQESSSGADTRTSNAGAVGGMQIIPATFSSVADKGWNINDPIHNARAGARYASQMYDAAGGDPQLAAAGYYGGLGGMDKARQGIAVSDPRNPNAPNTLQYGAQVASRMPQTSVTEVDFDPFQGASTSAPPARTYEYSDESNNPNYKPDPNSIRVDVAGTGNQPVANATDDPSAATQPPATNGKTTQLQDFGSAFGHHLLNIPHGGAQLVEHGVLGLTNLISPETPEDTASGYSNPGIANAIRSTVKADDIAMDKRESDYQASTPDSTGAYAGALAGEALPLLLSPFGKLVSGGGKLGQAAVAGVGGGSLLQGVGRLAGSSVGSAALGAGYSLTAPTNTQNGDYVDNKLSQVKTGAEIGAALPVAGNALSGVLQTGKYVGNVVGSFVKPFTDKGQNEIAGNIIRKFSKGGPTAVNSAEIVPGSTPTLAQATANPGIASLERGLRDANPNAFIEREGAQNSARNAAFDNVAGDSSKLDFFKADRAATAENLYGQAINNFNGKTTPAVQAEVEDLLKRPSVSDAAKVAKTWAQERGDKVTPPEGSLQSLHDIKTAIDDKISKAVRDGAGGEAKALQATKDKLVGVIDKLSPEYAQARATYAAMSEPVNAMKALQGLKLTDAQGNMTLQKVQTAIRTLQDRINAPGINEAKSVNASQLGTLTAIRDDLLRGSNSGLGKSVGSNTFQNIATNNILSNLLPGPLSIVADKTGASGLTGAVGNYIYKGSNEAIKNRLLQLHLDPQSAAPYLNASTVAPQNGIANALMNRVSPYAGSVGTVSAVDLANSKKKPK